MFFDYEVADEIVQLQAGGKIAFDKKNLDRYQEYYNRKIRKTRTWRQKKK